MVANENAPGQVVLAGPIGRLRSLSSRGARAGSARDPARRRRRLSLARHVRSGRAVSRRARGGRVRRACDARDLRLDRPAVRRRPRRARGRDRRARALARGDARPRRAGRGHRSWTSVPARCSHAWWRATCPTRGSSTSPSCPPRAAGRRAVSPEFASTLQAARSPTPRAAPSSERIASPPARTAGIIGLGAALPQRRVPNAEIGARLGVSAEWIERRTGITRAALRRARPARERPGEQRRAHGAARTPGSTRPRST